MSTPTVGRILVALKATLSTTIVDGKHSVFHVFLVALKLTVPLALKVVGILVALKATVGRNVNYHCWQDFGSSEKLRCQLRWVGVSIVPSRFSVALKATGTSVLKVVEILVALNATVDRSIKTPYWQDSGSSKSYSYREEKVAEPPERENL